MLALAEPLLYNDPPASYLFSTPRLVIVKQLAWYGLAPNTKKNYAAVINSYVSFYIVHNKKPYLVQTTMLEKWIATRIFGSTLPKQGLIKSDTVLSYLSALKLYHIDRCLSLTDFDDPYIALIIKSDRKLFPNKK